MNKDDFPIFSEHPELSYLDNAATSQKPQAVIKTITDFYTKSNANVHRGIYSLSEQATLLYEQARADIAAYLGATSEEIIFISGTTAGINLLAGYYFADKLDTDDLIILSEMEHHSNLIPWQILARKSGARIEYIRIDQDGRLDLEHYRELITNNKVAIVSLTQMSNVLGTINPIAQMAAELHAKHPESCFIVDAAQSMPHFKLKVSELGCDFLVASAHKCYGPTGSGILYGKKELLFAAEPFFTGGGMIRSVERESSSYSDLPERFEAGTPHISGALGFAAALNYLTKTGISSITAHEAHLSELLLHELLSIEGLKLYGPADLSERGPLYSFSLKDLHAHDLAQLLNKDAIAVRAGHHCCQILHRECLKVAATVRVSLGLYNNEQDIEKLVLSLKKIATSGLRA